MAKIRKDFKTRDELIAFISTNTLHNANVSGLYVEYDNDAEKDETPGCVGCNINYQPAEKEEPQDDVVMGSVPEPDNKAGDLEAAREAFEVQEGKPVPNNKKNALEWILGKLDS